MLVQILSKYRGVQVGAAVAAGVTSNVAATTSSVKTQVSGSNFYVFVVGQAGISTTTAVSDNKGNTYTQVGTKHTNSGPNTGNFFATEVFLCERGVGGSGHTFTANDTAGGAFQSILVIELIGAAASSSVDSNPGAADDGSSPYSTTGATATHNGLVLALIALANNTGDPVFVPAAPFVKQCAIETNTEWCGAIATATIANGATLGGSFTLQTGFTSDSIVQNIAIKSL